MRKVGVFEVFMLDTRGRRIAIVHTSEKSFVFNPCLHFIVV